MAPVDIHRLSIGAIKPYWMPRSCLTLGPGSNPAVVATSGVEKYVVRAHPVVKKFCE